jgi:allophanate hydrolase
LPFGISLVGPAFEDRLLARIATGSCVGRGMVQLAVVGAHLSGQPLNYQLTNRRAVLRRTTTTSSHYRLHALPTRPPKPGLVRRSDGGQSIEVEVWDVPVEEFGSFVDLVSAPLAIGSLELADGTWVKGFVCEPEALESSPDISRHLGWRAYLRSSTP